MEVGLPAEDDDAPPGGNGSLLNPRARPVLGDHCLVGKSPEGSRQSHIGNYITHAVCWVVLS